MAIALNTVSKRDGSFQLAFDQDAAGTDVLVADPVSGRIVVTQAILTLDATGKVKFTGAGNLSGDLDVAGNSGLAFRATKDKPFVECDKSEALSIVSTTGKASGQIVYWILPY